MVTWVWLSNKRFILYGLILITVKQTLNMYAFEDEQNWYCLRYAVPTMSTVRLAQQDQSKFQFFLKNYIKIYSRIWFGPVNANVHLEDRMCQVFFWGGGGLCCIACLVVSVVGFVFKNFRTIFQSGKKSYDVKFKLSIFPPPPPHFQTQLCYFVNKNFLV